MSIEATQAGRAFAKLDISPSTSEDGAAHLWVPVLDGTERLGVPRIDLPTNADPHDKVLRERCRAPGGQIAHLVMSEQFYSVLFHRVRRTQPLSVASKLLGQLLPSRVFTCEQVVIAAAMNPTTKSAAMATTTPSTRAEPTGVLRRDGPRSARRPDHLDRPGGHPEHLRT